MHADERGKKERVAKGQENCIKKTRKTDRKSTFRGKVAQGFEVMT